MYYSRHPTLRIKTVGFKQILCPRALPGLGDPRTMFPTLRRSLTNVQCDMVGKQAYWVRHGTVICRRKALPRFECGSLGVLFFVEKKNIIIRFSSIFGHIGEYESLVDFISGGKLFLSSDATMYCDRRSMICIWLNEEA